MPITPLLVTTGKGRQLRALDIACGPGGLGMAAYSKIARLMPYLEVSYNGFDASQYCGPLSNRGKNFSAELKPDTMMQKQLPKEPSNHYHHVHLHGLRTSILKQDFVQVFSDIKRIVSPGGYFFFSMDNGACKVTENRREDTGMLYAIEWLRRNFQIILSSYQNSMLAGNKASEIKSAAGEGIALPEAAGIFRLFGMDKPAEGIISSNVVVSLFTLFSSQATDSNYFAIGKKTKP